MRFSASMLSVIFHPLLLPAYASFIIIKAFPGQFFSLNIDTEMLMLRVIINTFILPVIIIMIMIPLGFIRNIHIEGRQERIIPYVTILFFYVWTFFSFYQQGLTPHIFNIVMLGALIAVILAFMVNILLFKISIHTVGMGVILGLLITIISSDTAIYVLPILLLAIIIAGLVGTARLVLISHDLKEVYTGYLVGMLSQLLAVNILL